MYAITNTMADAFELNNKEFFNDFRELLKNLLVTGVYSDIILVSDDLVPFKAHKLVICSQCTVFKDIVNALPENNSVVFLRGINSKEMNQLLQYLYIGQVTLKNGSIGDFKVLIQDLGINASFEGYNNDQLRLVNDIKNETVDDQYAPSKESLVELFDQVDSDLVVKGILETEPTDFQNFKGSNEIEEISSDIILNENNVDLKTNHKNSQIVSSNTLNHRPEFNTNVDEDMKEGFNTNVDESKYYRRSFIKNEMLKENSIIPIKNLSNENCTQDIQFERKKGKVKSYENQPNRKNCKYCGFIASSPASLYKHENIHKGIQYKCTECSHVTNDKSNLLKHMKNIHYKETTKCPTCNKEFKTIGSRYSHDCQRSYCDQCDKNFAFKSKLKEHIKIKHEGYSYPCLLCNYKAGQKTHLRTHVRLKHPETDTVSYPILVNKSQID